MKKNRLIGLVVITLTLLVVGAAAVPVLAQTNGQPANVSTGVYLDQPTLVRLAGVLGLTPAELSRQLQTGKTLAQIAAEKNVQPTVLVEALIAPHADQIALQVRYGYVTEEQAKSLLQTLKDQATLFLQQNLSAPAGNADWWQEMEDYCGNMMGNYGSTGYGGMMGGGMMGNYSGGYGGMMGPGMMRGFGGMGPGMMGGWGGYYNNPAPAPGSNQTTTPCIPGQSWNSGRGRGMMGGGMMGGW